MSNRKQFLNYFNFSLSLLVLNIINIPVAQAEMYHTESLPIGEYSFYERAFDKEVSYIRLRNDMIGALYDSNNPTVFTCFAVNIYQNGVGVLWWNNLWQINHPKANTLEHFYTIADFTADNVMIQPGLKNEQAIQQCGNMLGNI